MNRCPLAAPGLAAWWPVALVLSLLPVGCRPTTVTPVATAAPRQNAPVLPDGWPAHLADYQPRPAGARLRVCAQDGMPQVLVPAGSCTMGSSDAEYRQALALRQQDAHARTDQPSDERPPRKVQVAAFWADLHHVTVAQFKEYCRRTGARMPTVPDWCGDDHPMMMVTWHEATAYAKWVGRQLITEAQHERAARAGREGQLFVWGPGETPADGGGSVADETFLKAYPGRLIFKGYTDGFVQTAPAGSFRPNAYGLLDIAGNVWSWCRDNYEPDWYRRMPASNPVNQNGGRVHTCRGGSYYRSPYDLRIANRGRFDAAERYNCLGFRLVSPP